MTYFFSGLVAATLLGLGSVLVYGPGNQLVHSWVEPVFWALIVSGALMSLFERTRESRELPAARVEQAV